MTLDIQDIINSVSVPALIKDDFIRQGSFLMLKNGDFQAYVGGFSIVFPVEVNGCKWAYRCWHSDVNNSQRRYEIISDAIKKSQLQFLCEFDYVEEGITVMGKVYPTTRMRWIEGDTIKDYICKNKLSKDLLVNLAENFLNMVHALHGQSLAHGDLQHGNILVDEDHQLFLVDYDSFYCPQLKGEEDTVTGLPDYQHPARRTNKSVSEKLDYFSELIIYLSIRAIAEDPSLIDKYQVADADRLLFSKDDFIDLRHSEIYNDISSLGTEYVELLGVLDDYLKAQSINSLVPFDVLLLENKITISSSASKAVRNKQTINISWNIPFEAEVTIEENGQISNIETKGQISKTLSEDTTFNLVVKTSDGRQIRKQLSVRIFDECEIDLSADKQYIFPSIPVTLKWKVKNAKKVWLDDEEVNAIGAKIIKPANAISVVLTAEDEFGKKEKRINIGMLPIPIIKSLLVPTPNFESNLSVTVKQPRYNVDVKFPTIEIDWIKAEVPIVPSLTEMGLNVELSPPLPKVNFSLMSSIKRVFNHIIRK